MAERTMVVGTQDTNLLQDQRGAECSRFAQTLAQLAQTSHSDGRPLDVLASFATVIKDALDLDVVTVLETIADRDVLVIQAAAGLDASIVGQVAAKRDLKSMSGYTLLRQTAEVLEDVDRPGRPYEISSMKRAEGIKSGVTVPITPTRAIHGVLGTFSKEPRKYSDEEITFLNQAAYYLAGTILRHKEIALRKNVQRWLRVLEEATIRSVSATNHQSTLQSFTKFLTSSRDGITDVCFIDLESEDGHSIVREAAASNGTPLQITAQTSPLIYPPDPGCPYGTPAVLDTGKPHTISEVNHEHIESLARDEDHIQALTALDPVSFMCVPIRAHRHTLGALVLISCDQPFTSEDERHAGRLAYIVGMAIEGVRARTSRLSESRLQVEGYLDPRTVQQHEQIQPSPAIFEPYPDGPTVFELPKAVEAQAPVPSGIIGDTTQPAEDDTQVIPGSDDGRALSGRELEVLTLVAEGHHQPSISTQLGFGKWTYYTHIRNLKAKLGLSKANTSKLVTCAREQGYL